MPKEKPDLGGNWVKFLGTAGARFVMLRQLRSSGGLWLHLEGKNILIDPGPGSLVRALSSRPRLDPGILDAIILTHRHLDHSGDLGVMIEAMTEGGFKHRGKVYLPADALGEDSILPKYLEGFPEEIVLLEEGGRYSLEGLSFSCPLKMRHPVQTYGLKFTTPVVDLSLISDTLYFPRLAEGFRSPIVIINVVFHQPRPGIEHLSLEDAERLISLIRPQKAVLTHFGMNMVKAKPPLLAEELSRKLNIDVIAAYDGMRLELSGV